MEDYAKMIESLLEKAIDYGKTRYELGKLKAIDKASDVVSSAIPLMFALFLIATIMLFINLGLALWLGEILGKTYFGFLVVAGFYFILLIVERFLLHKWIKRCYYNYIIKRVFK